ncbi:hypothetical protein OAS39_03885 [Pirellulales bacterium]|nr:hypothetical protein [Pirellulales bacterium]
MFRFNRDAILLAALRECAALAGVIVVLIAVLLAVETAPDG